jgi:hypothetical protein
VTAARNCSVSPSYAAFAEAALPSLGWRTATGSLTVEELTVRRATALQLVDRAGRFDIRARAYVAEALAASGVPRAARPPGTDAPASMRRLLANLWSLKCGNDMKEVFWRLFHNGFPTAGRLHASGQRCGAGCSAVSPGRLHHFWECPVAQAVVAVLSAGLRRHCSRQPQPCAAPHLLATNVWLASPPSHCGVQAWAWQLVCLAAVAAMEHGRQVLRALQLDSGALGAVAVVGVQRRAVARFWDLLSAACSLGLLPRGQGGSPHQPCLEYEAGRRRWRPATVP